MPKLKPGVKKKTSTECSHEYIQRQKELLGEEKYKEQEAARQRLLWASKRASETEDAAAVRREKARLRKQQQRLREREKNRHGLVPGDASCVNTPPPHDAAQGPPAPPPAPGPLSVQLFKRGRRVSPHRDRQRARPLTQTPPPDANHPERRSRSTTRRPNTNARSLRSNPVDVTADTPIRGTPIRQIPIRGKLIPDPPIHGTPICDTPVRGTPIVDTTTDARQTTSREFEAHGNVYSTGDVRFNTRGVDDMNSHTPRVRDPMRDRQYHRNRKLRAKMEKERLAFGTEQIQSARARKRTDEALNLVRRNINRIQSVKERKKAVHLLASAAEIKSSRMGAEFARMFNLTSRSILYTNKGRIQQKFNKSENTWHLLMWFQDPEHSITCAGKKEKVVCRYKIENKTIKINKQKVILTEKLKTLYKVYNSRFPERKCKLTFFQDVRRNSQFIKTLDHAKAQVCLCMKHQNFAMKMRAISKFTKLSQNPDVLVREFSADNFEAQVMEIAPNLPQVIMYEEWRMTPVPYQDPKVDKTIKKLRQVPCELPRDSFVKMLVNEYPDIRVHVQLAACQHRTVREQRANLQHGEATIQMDFAQNWLIGYGQEVQPAYFAKDPVTVHPAVLHIRVGDEIKVVSLILVTDDRRHDSGAILAILDQICTFLKLHFPFVNVVHFWSDSPSSQYRNISMFSIICRHVERYGISCTWSYFEAGHGKGPCDGAGAAAKREAELAIKSGKSIVCAKDFVENGNASGSEMFYILVRVVDCYACRELLDYLVTPRKVPGTMTIHNVIVTKPGREIATRKVSCYLDCCWDSKNLCPVIPQHSCKTHGEWGKWQRHELYNDKILKLLNKKQVEGEKKKAEEEERLLREGTTASLEARALARNNTVERYDKGDYVAAIWGREWWIAIVRDVMVHEEYNLQFMHPISYIDSSISTLESDVVYVNWPSYEDMAVLKQTEILCLIAAPHKTQFEGVDCFTLAKKEVKAIEHLYQTFKF